MMNTECKLSDRHCKPCEGGVAAMSLDEAQQSMSEISGWTLSVDGASIQRRFEFKNFYQCMAFINAMAWVANVEDHHPDFSAGYKHCDITYTTHAIDGLSENDFICAAKINALITDL